MDKHSDFVAESGSGRACSIPPFHLYRVRRRRSFQIWIHVPFERTDKATGQKKPTLEVVIEKKSMVNLVRIRRYKH